MTERTERFEAIRAIILIVACFTVVTTGIPIRLVDAQDRASCIPTASPESSPVPAVASPPAIELPDVDLAWLELQHLLATSAADLASLASTDLQHQELAAFGQAQIDQADADQQQIDDWRSAWYPDADFPLEDYLTTIDNGKMELDLPAGAGGLDSLGATGGISLICAQDGPYDLLFIQSSIDLAQQQIDLAQVAVVYGTHPELVEFANAVIARESASIAQLVTWQDLWFGPEASPVAQLS